MVQTYKYVYTQTHTGSLENTTRLLRNETLMIS